MRRGLWLLNLVLEKIGTQFSSEVFLLHAAKRSRYAGSKWPPKTHTDIFIASDNKGDEQLYGREVLNEFLRRVWRRPVAKLIVTILQRLGVETESFGGYTGSLSRV